MSCQVLLGEVKLVLLGFLLVGSFLDLPKFLKEIKLLLRHVVPEVFILTKNERHQSLFLLNAVGCKTFNALAQLLYRKRLALRTLRVRRKFLQLVNFELIQSSLLVFGHNEAGKTFAELQMSQNGQTSFNIVAQLLGFQVCLAELMNSGLQCIELIWDVVKTAKFEFHALHFQLVLFKF